MEEKNIKQIIKEEDVVVRGENYKQIDYDDGTSELHGFDEKYKMKVVLKFKEETDEKTLENIRQVVKNGLLNTIQY